MGTTTRAPSKWGVLTVLVFFLCLGAGWANADWTATCTTGCTCKWADGKKVAECPNAGFTTIPENLSPEIQVLDLRGNKLDVLVNRAFSSVGLINLQRIFLRNCSIRQVDKDAFHELNIMIEVDLSHNQLSRIHPDTFNGNEKLRFLSLSHNPLEKLEAHQFPSLPHLRMLELVNCRLQMVDKKAFMHLSTLQTLKLSANRFTSLKPDVFQPLNKLKSLDLQDNPWVCDCHLLALRDYLSEANLNSTLTLCDEPEHLKGRPWSRLASEDFACKPLIDVSEQHVEGRLGFDVTFSCRVSGSPSPTIWWVLQNRQVVNTSTASQGEQFVIRQSTHPAAPRTPHGNYNNNPTSQPLLLSSPPGEPEMEHWSNLTLRRISEQDAGQYRCIARNKGGQVEANVSLQTPPAPVIIMIEEDTGVPQTTVVAIASAAALLLLAGFLFLTVCLCRRARRKKKLQRLARERQDAAASAKQNGGKALNGGNGILSSADGSSVLQNEQEKSLLEIEMMDHRHHHHHHHNTSGQHILTAPDGYQAVAQTDMEVQQQHQQQQQQMQARQQQLMMQRGGSSTYIPGERFPETLTRHLMTDVSGMMQAGSAHHQVQLADGSFYPDMLLDIPNRGSGRGGSPSTHSGNSAETATTAVQSVMTMPLSAIHLAAHHHPGYVQPPLQFTDTASTTSSTALLIPGGSRPGYVTLPRRPRPRMPSWASSPPPMSGSPGPGSIADEHQPLYDTIGPRVTADGSSASALSLNKIAGLTPGGGGGGGSSSGLGSPRASTLARGHKISLPAYYVPIEEVDIPSSPLVQQRHNHQSSTPNMLNYYNNNNNNNSSSNGSTGEADQQAASIPETADAPLLSPIPDFRQQPAGSRASVASLNSTSSLKKKVPPAVAPKPGSGGLVRARPASVVTSGGDHGPSSSTTPLSPAKVAPKPPPKPKKRAANGGAGTNGDGLLGVSSASAFEDEGEDGTEV